MEFRRHRRTIPQINLTPLIDVVLLLLVFFMLSTTFVFQPGIRVNLPRAVTAEQAPKRDLVLILARDGRVYLNDRLVPFQELWGRLVNELKVQPEGYLVIRADKEVSHGRVVAVMDIAKQAGAQRLAIATQPARKVVGRR